MIGPIPYSICNSTRLNLLDLALNSPNRYHQVLVGELFQCVFESAYARDSGGVADSLEYFLVADCLLTYTFLFVCIAMNAVLVTHPMSWCVFDASYLTSLNTEGQPVLRRRDWSDSITFALHVTGGQMDPFFSRHRHDVASPLHFPRLFEQPFELIVTSQYLEHVSAAAIAEQQSALGHLSRPRRPRVFDAVRVGRW